MEAGEIDEILGSVKWPGSNATIAWIAQNEDGAWDDEFAAVMQTVIAYRKKRRKMPCRRDSDVYHAMKLMGYGLPDRELQSRLEYERRHRIA